MHAYRLLGVGCAATCSIPTNSGGGAVAPLEFFMRHQKDMIKCTEKSVIFMSGSLFFVCLLTSSTPLAKEDIFWLACKHPPPPPRS